MDLYASDRQRIPLEDIADSMRGALQVTVSDEPRTASLVIRFEYPDRETARQVVRTVLERLRLTGSSPEVLVVEGASLPHRPVLPNRARITAGGLVAGALLGVLIAFLRTRPLKWRLRMAATAAVGLVAATSVAFGLEIPYPEDLQLGGLGLAAALLMGAILFRTGPRQAGSRTAWWKTVVLACLTGTTLAGFVWFAMPKRYVSTAVVRMPPIGPARERVYEVTQQLMSPADWNS